MYNIFLWVIILIGGGAGALSTLYIVASLFGTLGFKIYRTARYHISLFD